MSALDAARIAAVMGGEARGNQAHFPTPGHSPRDRGVSVTVDPAAPDGFLVHVHNGGDALAIKADIMTKLGIEREASRASDHHPSGWRVTGVFEFRDRYGAMLYRTRRHEHPAEAKRFTAERPDGHGGWISGLGDTERVLYRLPELLAADPAEPFYLVEGERKADKLASLGLTATAVAFGCKGWRKTYCETLKGRTVVILPDNDEPGAKFASRSAADINAAGGKAVIVELPGLPQKGDVLDWSGTADELRALVNAKLSEAAPPSDSALPIEWGEDIEPRLDALWLIERTLPQEGLALIFGHPGSGKTFLALDMGGHIAMGWDWHGLEVRQGVVIYICAEGQNGARNRIAAFKRRHGIMGTFSLALVPCSVNLFDPAADRVRVAAAVRRAVERYGQVPVLIIIDTISKTMGGGKENTDDLAVYLSNCGWLSSEFRCCVMPIHHRPKDQDSTDPRGHGSLMGGLDTAILVDEVGKTKRARITKQRDDEERVLAMFNLEVLDLGVDKKDKPVTSCTVVPTLTDLAPKADPFAIAVGKLSAGPRLIYEQLGETLEAEGFAIPTDIPDREIDRLRVGKVALLEAWRDKSISAAGTDAGHSRDAGKKAFNRALTSLRERRIVRVWEDWAWITFDVGGTRAGQ